MEKIHWQWTDECNLTMFSLISLFLILFSPYLLKYLLFDLLTRSNFVPFEHIYIYTNRQWPQPPLWLVFSTNQSGVIMLNRRLQKVQTTLDSHREVTYTLRSPQRRSFPPPWNWYFPGAELRPQSEAPWTGSLQRCQPHPWHAGKTKERQVMLMRANAWVYLLLR